MKNERDIRLFLTSHFVSPNDYKGGATSHCVEVGCGKPTNDGKSRCPDHVHLMPYAAQVAARVAPEPRGRAYELVCQDCNSPFRAASRAAKRCRQCKRDQVNRRDAERKRQRREAS